ncbi:hypothetical protein OAG91_01955 [bacterium]|nr:hypothetical protein [bacterium]
MKILCLTGTNPYSFSRLVSFVDQVLGPKHQVVIQLGNTEYEPIYSECFDFLEKSKVESFISEADIVITQGGYGSMTDVLNRGKMLIAAPRLMGLGESKDDQTELVDFYAKKNYLLPCYDIENLEDLVNKLADGKVKLTAFKSETGCKINSLIEDYLNSLNL